MIGAMPFSLSWNSLKSWAGSQHAAFEHVCAALAKREGVPHGSLWTKNGRPDGGVECFWALPSGDIWAWQAKWFLGALGPSQWKQLNESVQTALAAYPRLRQYFVCIPQDFPNAAHVKGTSSRDKWAERVKRWRTKARSRGMDVEFVLWDEGELLDRLALQQNAGLVSFWFNASRFASPWFSRQLVPALVHAGPRYTQEAHVDVPDTNALWCLGWDGPLHRDTTALREKLYVTHASLTRYLEDDSSLSKLQATVDHLRKLLHTDSARPDTVLRPADIEKSATSAINLASQIGNTASASGDLKSAARAFMATASHARDFAEGPEATAASTRSLLLIGPAGNGKTHLLCDRARRRVALGQPTLLAFGEHFADTDPLAQLPAMFGLSCGSEEFLQSLDAAGEAHGSRVLLIIDALNEGRGPSIWPARLAGFVTRVLAYPHLALALIIRTPYDQTQIPTNLGEDVLPGLPIGGFEGLEYEALRSVLAPIMVFACPLWHRLMRNFKIPST